MATILIVDDRAANRTPLVTLLGDRGHRLLEAADGRAALAVVRAEAPDLIITDVLMPVMNGYELVRQLRFDPATQAIPVLFYTAHYGAREARARARVTGVAGVLTKPVDPTDAITLVDQVLSGRAGADQPSDAPSLTMESDREQLHLLVDPPSLTAGDLALANTRLRALINIGLELASESDAGQLLARVCVAAHDLFGATFVTLGILDRTNRAVQRVEACGIDAASWIEPGAVVPGILGTVVAERRTLRGSNPGGDPASLGLPPLHPHITAFLAAPIASTAHVYGWICLAGNEGRAFTEDDEQLVMALAGQVGRLYELAYSDVERTHAQAALHHERDRAQRYLDAADVILLGLDPDGTITLINRKGCDVLGWTERELLGRDWIGTCLPGRTQDALRTTFGDLVAGDLTIVENTICTRSGAERLIEWHNTILRDDAGRMIGTLSSGTDITERRRAEEAQRASEGRYRTLFDYAPDGIVIADRESYYIDANASMCAMLGYSRDELVGLHASDIVSRAEVQHIAPALRAITGLSDYHREWQFRRKDGSLFTADVIATPMPDGTLLGMIRDVTERNLAVETLRVAEERMRFALENANVGIWDMDYTTGVLRWSATSEAHYGLPPATFGGSLEAFVECIHPDDRESALANVAEAMKAGSDFSLQHRTLWPDGTIRWISGAGRVLLGEHGEPIRAVGISQDVTERKKAEAELRRLNDEIQLQRVRVFKATIRTVQDIVNNLLNGFQLVLLEAHGHLPADLLTLVERAIEGASAKLKTLAELETITEKKMAIGLGIDYPGSGS